MLLSLQASSLCLSGEWTEILKSTTERLGISLFNYSSFIYDYGHMGHSLGARNEGENLET